MAASGTPLRSLPAPLPPLLRRSRPVLGDVPGEHPVFYTREALRMAERLARKGGRAVPAVESGGVLVGPLCSCPDTGEMFAVITDVLEATDARARTFSLAYSGATWARIQAVMRAKERIRCRRADRILGQVHGHNFPPHGDDASCLECGERDTCRHTSAFLSESDLRWCRAVFSGQPWQVSHIFGLDARGATVDAFFGQQDGRLAARGYRVVETFSSADLVPSAGEASGRGGMGCPQQGI
jgi:hypothetical protein